MEIVEIDGITCVFPESMEKSLQKLSDEILGALYRGVIEGKISMETLDEIIEEDKKLTLETKLKGIKTY